MRRLPIGTVKKKQQQLCKETHLAKWMFELALKWYTWNAYLLVQTNTENMGLVGVVLSVSFLGSDTQISALNIYLTASGVTGVFTIFSTFIIWVGVSITF